MKKTYRKKSKTSVTMIGGSDGPTSVFVAGKPDGGQKNPLRRFRNWRERRLHLKRRAQAIRSITPNPHTPDELAAYITEKYHAVELAQDGRRVQEGCRNTKASIVQRQYPEQMELLGYISPRKKRPQDLSDQAALEEWFGYIKEYEDKAAGLDDGLVPMDYHMYEIRTGNTGALQLELEKIRGLLCISCGAEKNERKRMQEIWRDIYLYYGVSQEDIEKSTDRYLALVMVLAEKTVR